MQISMAFTATGSVMLAFVRAMKVYIFSFYLKSGALIFVVCSNAIGWLRMRSVTGLTRTWTWWPWNTSPTLTIRPLWPDPSCSASGCPRTMSLWIGRSSESTPRPGWRLVTVSVLSTVLAFWKAFPCPWHHSVIGWIKHLESVNMVNASPKQR